MCSCFKQISGTLVRELAFIMHIAEWTNPLCLLSAFFGSFKWWSVCSWRLVISSTSPADLSGLRVWSWSCPRFSGGDFSSLSCSSAPWSLLYVAQATISSAGNYYHWRQPKWWQEFSAGYNKITSVRSNVVPGLDSCRVHISSTLRSPI